MDKHRDPARRPNLGLPSIKAQARRLLTEHRTACWIAAALALLFGAMNFHVLALDFTTTPPPSVGFSNYGPSDQEPRHAEHMDRPLAGYYTADPYGTVALAPFDHFTLASTTRLQVPFWNPLTLTGYPFLPEFYWGIFYPPKILLAVLPDGFADFYSALHILLAGLFLGWLCWTFTRDRFAAAFAGACVFGTGFLLMYFPTHTIIVVVPWGVLLLAAIERLSRTPSSLTGFLAATAAVAGLGVAGHPPVALFFTLGAGLFLALRLLIAGGWRGLPALFLASAAGVLLALPNLVGFVSTLLSGDAAAGATLHPNYYSLLKFLQFLLPYAAGPVNEAARSLQPDFGAPSYSFAWGPPLVLFAAAAGLHQAVRLRMWSAMALAASGVGLSLLGLGLLPLGQWIPEGVLNRLNMNYVWIYPGMVICVLAGLGLRALVTAKPRDLAWQVLAPFAAVTLFAGATYYQRLTGGRPGPLSGDVVVALERGVAPGLLWAIGAPSLVLFAAWGTRRSPTFRAVIVPALLALGLGLSTVGYYPSANLPGRTVLPLAAFALFCVATPVMVWPFLRWPERKGRMLAAGVLLLVVGGASAIANLIYPGLPPRYHKVVPPPYVSVLKKAGPNWRSYGIDGALASDNLVRFDVPVIDNENTMLPKQLWSFFQNYVDPTQQLPIVTGMSSQPGGPGARIIANRRIWDYLSVRYVLAPKTALEADPEQRALFGVPKDDLSESDPAPDAADPSKGATPVNLPVAGQAGAEPLRVTLSCGLGPFSAVRIKLSTHGRVNPGQIHLTLTDARGRLLTEASAPAPAVQDNEIQTFALPQEVCRTGGGDRVILNLEQTGATPDLTVAAWLTPNKSLFALPVRRPLLTELVPLAGGDPLQVELSCAGGPFSMVRIKLSTYRRHNPGRVRAFLTDLRGRELSEAWFPAPEVKDNALNDFAFQRPACASGEGRVVLNLQHLGVPGKNVAAWSTATAPILAFPMYEVLAPDAPLTAASAQGELLQKELAVEPGRPVLLPLAGQPGAQPLTTALSCGGGPFSTVRIRLATYGRSNPGVIRAMLSDLDGRRLTEASTPAPALQDNALQDFVFPQDVCGDGRGEVMLSLIHEGEPGKNVAVWSTPTEPFIAVPTRKTMPNAADMPLAAYDGASGMMVFENPTAQPRAYLPRRLEQAPNWELAMAAFVAQPDLRQVAFTEPGAPACSVANELTGPPGSANVTSVKPNEVRISADSRGRGPLVMVDTYADGWTAQVDGAPTPLFRVNGVFRGLCLPGAGRHQVVMRFKPPYWRGVAWAPVGGALLILAAAAWRRRQKRGGPEQAQPAA